MLQISCVNENKNVTLQSQKRKNGSLDEWFSQRSAKPSTAVRVRQGPQKSGRKQFPPLFLCASMRRLWANRTNKTNKTNSLWGVRL